MARVLHEGHGLRIVRTGPSRYVLERGPRLSALGERGWIPVEDPGDVLGALSAVGESLGVCVWGAEGPYEQVHGTDTMGAPYIKVEPIAAEILLAAVVAKLEHAR